MVIKNSTPLSLAEVSEIVGEGTKEEKIGGFIKKLHLKHLKKSQELKKKLEELNLLKLKKEHIIKIIDFVPETTTELNKVLQGVSLDQDEVNKILEALK